MISGKSRHITRAIVFRSSSATGCVVMMFPLPQARLSQTSILKFGTRFRAGNRACDLRNSETEVAPLLGLRHSLKPKPLITTPVRDRGRRLPFAIAAGKFSVVHEQGQHAASRIQPDPVTAADESQRARGPRCPR